MSHGPQFPGDTREGNIFPDIGPDPSRATGKTATGRMNQAIERLSEAMSVQQRGVPDQTALVWRRDLDWLMTELIVTRMQREELKREIERLKEPLICAITVARDMEQKQKL